MTTPVGNGISLYNPNAGVYARSDVDYLDDMQYDATGSGIQSVPAEELLALHARKTGEWLSKDQITAPPVSFIGESPVPPIISEQPVIDPNPQVVLTEMTITVEADYFVSVLWQRSADDGETWIDGPFEDMTGEDELVLTAASADAAMDGLYRLVLTNQYGTTTSDSVEVEVTGGI